MSNSNVEAEQIDAMLKKVAALPDASSDGLDLKQAKNNAIASLTNAKTALLSAIKLAS